MLVERIIFSLIVLIPGLRCEVKQLMVEAGSQVVLPCQCPFAPCDPATITWNNDKKGTIWRKQQSGLEYWGSSWIREKDTSRIRCPHTQFASGDYSLEINNVQESDGGQYFCMVEFRGKLTKSKVMLRVIRVSVNPPDPTWLERVSVTCSVTPTLRTSSVNWFLNDVQFKPKNVFSKNLSVLNEEATDKLVGKWTCAITYDAGKANASTIMSVRGIIQPPKNDTKIYAAMGSPVVLPCIFSPELKPDGTFWESPNKKKPLTIRKTHPSSANFSTTIQTVESDDQGEYSCAGRVNGIGLTRTMKLVVAKIVQSKKESLVMLNCQLTDSGEVTRYEWVNATYDINGTASYGPVLTGETVFVPANHDEWTCSYYGNQGRLGNVTTQILLTAFLKGQQSSRATGNTGTILGLSFLLIVLLMVLIQMFRNHQRRRRIFQYPAMETRIHTICNEQEQRERNRMKV